MHTYQLTILENVEPPHETEFPIRNFRQILPIFTVKYYSYYKIYRIVRALIRVQRPVLVDPPLQSLHVREAAGERYRLSIKLYENNTFQKYLCSKISRKIQIICFCLTEKA